MFTVRVAFDLKQKSERRRQQRQYDCGVGAVVKLVESPVAPGLKTSKHADANRSAKAYAGNLPNFTL